ncbi:MAG: hypothetical protein ACYDCK_03780 [Thermoplasmatota archaeon]
MKTFAKLGTSGIIAALLVASFAVAAITLSYTSTSSAALHEVAPPLQWGIGTDAASTSLYIPAIPTLNTNKTAFTSTSVRGVPGATLTVASFITLTNTDTVAHTVTITTASDSATTGLTAYTLAFTGGATGTLDYRAGSPSVTLTVAASGVATGALTVTMSDGASINGVSNTLTMGNIS